MTDKIEFKISADKFLNKSCIIYGGSKSGKTIMLKDILFHLKDQVFYIIAIAGQEGQNHAYEGIIPPNAIYTKTDVKFLEKLYERQEMATSKYDTATNLDILKKLYDRCNDKSCDSELFKLEEMRATYISRAKKDDDKEIIEENYKKTKIKLYKKVIETHKDKLPQCKLTEEEITALNNLDLNPHMILLFDDVAASMPELSKSEIMQKIFFQGRWVKITPIILTQSDSAINTKLRLNAHYSIFTEMAFSKRFYTKTNGFDTEDTKYHTTACKNILSNKHDPFRKAIYVKENREIYWIKAVKHIGPFQCGDDKFHKLCNEVKGTSNNRMKGNTFYKKFA